MLNEKHKILTPSSFLKLCKIKYYNFSPIHTVQPNFSLQTGDPIGPGSKDSDGGSSIWGLLDGRGASSPLKTFTPEFHPKLRHTERGTISMASVPSAHDPDQRESGSQFLITLGDNLEYLDGKAAIFGKVVEGFDALEKINTAFLDDKGRPLKDIRIRHTIVLDEENIPDPPGLREPSASPVPTPAQLATVRIADDESIDENADQATVEKLRREREARQQALTLEMVGDLPFAEVAPPENVLFVCKLNPVTDSESLDMIFGRFGKILSCEVIRDKRTGDSLQYAFIEYAEKEMAELAYFKMSNVLIDDHRIHVDFSQSVSRLADDWRDKTNKKRSRGVPGGFGGMDGLEKKRQYRAHGEDTRWDAKDSGRQDMVLDRRAAAKPTPSSRPRSRSPPRRGTDAQQSHGHRQRSPSRERYRDRDDRRRQERSRDRERDRDRYRDDRRDDRRRR